MFKESKFRKIQSLDADMGPKGDQKMAKSTRKRAKGTISIRKSKKSKKATKAKIGLAECIDCLLELHKLQGELLTELAKGI